jgi:hypothetical protein
MYPRHVCLLCLLFAYDVQCIFYTYELSPARYAIARWYEHVVRNLHPFAKAIIFHLRTYVCLFVCLCHDHNKKKQQLYFQEVLFSASRSSTCILAVRNNNKKNQRSVVKIVTAMGVDAPTGRCCDEHRCRCCAENCCLRHHHRPTVEDEGLSQGQ